MHIKEPLLLIGKSSSCDGSGFPPSLSLTPYNRVYNVLRVSFMDFTIHTSSSSKCHRVYSVISHSRNDNVYFIVHCFPH